MNKIITPAFAGAPPLEDKDFLNAPPEEKASVLPNPTGFKLLIALPEPEEKTGGGIVKATATLDAEEVSSITGFVLKMGPDAYADKTRFPNGPYCKVGDWIVMRAYTGTRFKIFGKEFRLLNDDSVEAVVDDPRGLTRV